MENHILKQKLYYNNFFTLYAVFSLNNSFLLMNHPSYIRKDFNESSSVKLSISVQSSEPATANVNKE